MYKDILVYLDDSAHWQPRLIAAAELASDHGAHLTGLFVKPYLPSVTRNQLEIMSLAEMIDEFNAQTRKAEAHARERFEEVLKAASVTGEWQYSQGDPAVCVNERARYTDLVVVGQGTKDDAPVVAELPDSVLMGSGRPVYVVPANPRNRPVSGRVLVAWNGGRESARALADAMPLLKQAQEVIVACVNAPDADRRLPGAEIATHLARHDIRVDVQVLESGAQGAGHTLRSYADERGMDAIVMGAYGHARMREIILGGMTREMLRQSTLPLLLSH